MILRNPNRDLLVQLVHDRELRQDVHNHAHLVGSGRHVADDALLIERPACKPHASSRIRIAPLTAQKTIHHG